MKRRLLIGKGAAITG